MLPLGMVLGTLAYGMGSWGYILVKGYNITLREWFSPIHPYTGSLASAGTVPQGSVFPTSGKGGGAAGSGSGSPVPQMEQKAGNIARKQNRPVPQGPGSRL